MNENEQLNINKFLRARKNIQILQDRKVISNQDATKLDGALTSFSFTDPDHISRINAAIQYVDYLMKTGKQNTPIDSYLQQQAHLNRIPDRGISPGTVYYGRTKPEGSGVVRRTTFNQ